ncbi:MAG: PIN domain-containing protein, partial [Spirochaetales bacterium]|nr:PIN domain-containing protein [Spirochaetales bacterium]
YKLLREIIDGKIKIAISVSLVLEYECILKRHLNRSIFNDSDIEEIINYICKIGEKVKIYYLWRPYLRDYFDDHILEVAINSGCHKIITYNIKDFKESDKLGIKALTPGKFLEEIEGGKK